MDRSIPKTTIKAPMGNRDASWLWGICDFFAGVNQYRHFIIDEAKK